MIYKPMQTNHLEIELNREIHARLYELHCAIAERLQENERMRQDGLFEIMDMASDYSREIEEIMYGDWKGEQQW